MGQTNLACFHLLYVIVSSGLLLHVGFCCKVKVNSV